MREKNGAFLIWVWKLLYSRCILKIVRLTTIRNVSKRTISTSCELGLLQMILELDNERCASENVGPLKVVDCEIPH